MLNTCFFLITKLKNDIIVIDRIKGNKDSDIMRVSLIKRDKIYDLRLPSSVYGSYWIADKDDKGINRELINIEEAGGKWKVKSNSDNKLVDNKGVPIRETYLTEYSFNYMKIEKEETLAIIYCSPVYDRSSICLDVKNAHNIYIGSGSDNQIAFSIAAVAPKHALLKFNNGKWAVEDLNSDFGLYVNNKRTKNSNLENGDMIFIMGLKIIILGDSIIINNPFNQVRLDQNIFYPHEKKVQQIVASKEEEETELELYEESEYFFRSPRFKTIIEKEKMNVDSPPGKEKQEEMPLIYTLGPMLTMSMMSMMTLYNTIESVLSGNRPMKQAIPAFIMSGVMLLSMFLWPTLNRRYQKRKKKEREEERQDKYGKYVDGKANEIDIIMKKQKQILLENYITSLACENIILSKNRQLWERKIEQDDFLSLRLGLGNKAVEMDINYPEEHFSMDEDNLKDILQSIMKKSKDLTGVPITLNLTEKYIAGIVGTKSETLEYVKQLIMQIITFHSYEDVKLVFFVDNDYAHEWEYVKTIPHTWSDDKKIRFFASNYEDMRQLSSWLSQDFQNRVSSEGRSEEKYKSFLPYYIIITDDYKISKNLEIMIDALKQKQNFGFNVIVINENLSTLPNECTTFLSVTNGRGGLFESELASTKQHEFVIDNYASDNLLPCILKTANIPIKFSKEMFALPSSYSFLEMYKVGRIEQLNPLYRWRNNDTTSTLQAPIGIDSHGMPFKLDVHEKYHGPHGLIAGMTGSGKSEFIITYILSLAVNYHPDDVSFVLIDYKGGGLTGAFTNDETGIRLPHLAGTITNLDISEIQRALVSIQSELRRRQALFNEAREQLNEGTIDIYKYQRLYHEGLVKEPVSHLLIISDEFAELKSQQPEFMDQLISTARIGRSLGVHLILATQKPAGVVNDQIWSNSRFRICLKVQEKADSMDMIKTPEAASLKQAGRFYLQVGYNEFFGLGQSAWCGATYIPTDKVRKKVDGTIEFIDDIGNVVKEAKENIVVNVDAKGEQLINIVKYLHEVAEKEKIKVKQLWLAKIPEFIYIDRLAKKYNFVPQRGVIHPIIGEYDDPFNQRQGLLTMRFTKDGNTLVYGSAGSGKEMLLSTIIYGTITNYSPDEVNFYIMDLGAESLKMYARAPHVGDVLYVNDTEKITNLFKLIQGEMDTRKKLFVDFNGDYQYYIRRSGGMLPLMVIILNNFEVFSETYPEYDDTILQLTREGNKYGIVFLITASSSNAVRHRIAQNFKQKYVLQLNNENDYSSLLGNMRGKSLSEFSGRGFIELEDTYEFQTAHICDDNELTEKIKITCDTLKASATIFAKPVPILPDVVTFDYVRSAFKDLKSLPIGVENKNLSIATYDVRQRFATTITSADTGAFKKFVPALIKASSYLANMNLIVLDAEELLNNIEFVNVDYNSTSTLNSKYEEILNNVMALYDAYKAKNFDASTLAGVKHSLIIIIGMDRLKTRLSDNNKNSIDKLFETAKELDKFNIIFVDTVDKFKKMEYDNWYRSIIVQNYGIWLGSGISDQFTIKLTKTSKDLYEDIGNSFGYIVERGIPTRVKLLQDDNGVSKDGDSNE